MAELGRQAARCRRAGPGRRKGRWPGAESPDWLRERRLLLALAVGLPLAEMGALAALGLRSGMGLAGQVTAPGPFGVFHDLRLLFVFHDSVLGFVVGAVGLVAGRSLLGALLARAAWPGSPPPFLRVLRHMLVITAAAAVFLSPWVTLLFGAAVIPLSWIYFAALPPAVATILVLHHGGVDGGWWRRLPPARSAAWMALSFLVLSLSALGVAGQPLPVVAAVLVATGLFNAWAWDHSVGVIVTGLPGRSRRWAPVTVVTAVLIFVGVVGGSQIGFAVRAYTDPGTWVSGEPEAGDRAVLLVGGFASGCCDEGPILQGDTPGVYVEQFSYLGADRRRATRCPTRAAPPTPICRAWPGWWRRRWPTWPRQTGGPVAIVAESEGTLVATAYLEAYPDAPVDRLMLLSPIVDPGRATYPDPRRGGLRGGGRLRVARRDRDHRRHGAFRDLRRWPPDGLGAARGGRPCGGGGLRPPGHRGGGGGPPGRHGHRAGRGGPRHRSDRGARVPRGPARPPRRAGHDPRLGPRGRPRGLRGVDRRRAGSSPARPRPGRCPGWTAWPAATRRCAVTG